MRRAIGDVVIEHRLPAEGAGDLLQGRHEGVVLVGVERVDHAAADARRARRLVAVGDRDRDTRVPRDVAGLLVGTSNLRLMQPWRDPLSY